MRAVRLLLLLTSLVNLVKSWKHASRLRRWLSSSSAASAMLTSCDCDCDSSSSGAISVNFDVISVTIDTVLLLLPAASDVSLDSTD